MIIIITRRRGKGPLVKLNGYVPRRQWRRRRRRQSFRRGGRPKQTIKRVIYDRVAAAPHDRATSVGHPGADGGASAPATDRTRLGLSAETRRRPRESRDRRRRSPGNPVEPGIRSERLQGSGIRGRPRFRRARACFYRVRLRTVLPTRSTPTIRSAVNSLASDPKPGRTVFLCFTVSITVV